MGSKKRSHILVRNSLNGRIFDYPKAYDTHFLSEISRVEEMGVDKLGMYTNLECTKLEYMK